MVFQNPDNQMVATIVEEDVAFGPENLGVPQEELRKRVDNALKEVNMLQFKDSAPHRLSGGQKQRIAIAGVIAMEPEVIIMDESTSMLDPKGRREVLETVHRLNKEKGITVVFITHFMEETVNADRIIVMEDGKVAAFDTHENLLANCGIYREIYETQTSGSGDFDETNSDKDIEVYDINKQAPKKPGMPPFPMPPMGEKKSRKHKEVKMP